MATKRVQDRISAVMVGNYLTTPGNKISDDIEMIKGLGFEV